MTGYTRQSVADIINGLDITAPPLNAEFNQVAAAFDGSTGHAHDGSAGNAPKINLSTSVDGYLPADHGGVGGRNKTDATSNPTVTNDAGEGYAPGSLWLNTSTGRVFICAGNATGAAVWREAAQITENGVFFPETNDTVDLGTTAKRFKNLYLSGAADIQGNAIVGGSLSVTGATTLSTATVSGTANLSTVDIDAGSIDGTTVGASSPAAASFTTISASGLSTLPTVNIDGGNVDGTVIGNTTPSAITGTVVTANTGFTGDLTGNVTGNLTGNVTGDVTGNLTGDVTGDVNSSGTSTFQNVTINGSLDMNAGTSATVTGLATPVNTTDAATKGYVDQEVTAVIDAAPGALDTLNELAAALNDDANFATTVNNSIATKVSKSGDTMTGQLDMGTNKVVNVAAPTAGSDATTKAYVDGVDATKLNLSGGTMTGNIVMGANKVTSTANPTADDDLARKAYVDSILGSATAAATSASNAATSETNAATSEANAAASASAAAASFDSFDDRYLGAKASAPTADNDGDALLTGAIYWNTTDSSLFVYDGSAWAAAVFETAGAVILNNWTISESGGALLFATGGTNYMKLDAAGNLQVVGTVEANATIS